MTQKEFKTRMNIYGNRYFEETCPVLQAEIVRKIMNCKALSDFNKMKILSQYIENLATNNIIVDGIKQYNNR